MNRKILTDILLHKIKKTVGRNNYLAWNEATFYDVINKFSTSTILKILNPVDGL